MEIFVAQMGLDRSKGGRAATLSIEIMTRDIQFMSELKHLQRKNSMTGKSATGLVIEGTVPRDSDPGQQIKSEPFLGGS